MRRETKFPNTTFAAKNQTYNKHYSSLSPIFRQLEAIHQALN